MRQPQSLRGATQPYMMSQRVKNTSLTPSYWLIVRIETPVSLLVARFAISTARGRSSGRHAHAYASLWKASACGVSVLAAPKQTSAALSASVVEEVAEGLG